MKGERKIESPAKTRSITSSKELKRTRNLHKILRTAINSRKRRKAKTVLKIFRILEKNNRLCSKTFAEIF